jgi:hypothetical protein
LGEFLGQDTKSGDVVHVPEFRVIFYQFWDTLGGLTSPRSYGRIFSIHGFDNSREAGLTPSMVLLAGPDFCLIRRAEK